MGITELELDRRLAATRDRVGEQPEARASIDAVRAARTEGRRRRTRRRGLGTAAAAALLALGIAAGPAAADRGREFLAQADWFPESGSEVLAGSEWIDTSAIDFPEYLVTKYPNYVPLAPGHSRDDLIARVLATFTTPALTQEVSIRRGFEQIGYCDWIHEWNTNADPSARERATGVLREAIEWPAMNATDGGGIVANMRQIADHSEHGDEAAMRRAELNECDYSSVAGE